MLLPPPPRPPYGYGRGYGETGAAGSRAEVTSEVERDVHTPAEDILGPSPIPTRYVGPPPPSATPTPTETPATEALTATPVVETPPTTPESASREDQINQQVDELGRYLADETRSPVHADSRAEAISGARDFVFSPEIKDAESLGGLDQLTAARVYQEILDWLKNNSLPALEVDDGSINADTLDYVHAISEVAYSTEPAPIVEKRANLLAKFVQDLQAKGIFDAMNQGDSMMNIYTLAILYNKVKNLRLNE